MPFHYYTLDNCNDNEFVNYTDRIRNRRCIIVTDAMCCGMIISAFKGIYFHSSKPDIS